jgi:uncharacterized membrane protein YraQ (UPF0718 family)
MTHKAGQFAHLSLAIAFGLLVAVSYASDIELGRQMGRTFETTALTFLGLLPCAFILIALFDVWVKRETIERHLGRDSGPQAYLSIMLLAGMTVGGLYVAFPVAYSLTKKGARLGLVLTYVNFAGICRIPMVAFEASIMGWKFTATRMLVSVPLVIIASELLGRSLERRGFQVHHLHDQ